MSETDRKLWHVSQKTTTGQINAAIFAPSQKAAKRAGHDALRQDFPHDKALGMVRARPWPADWERPGR